MNEIVYIPEFKIIVISGRHKKMASEMISQYLPIDAQDAGMELIWHQEESSGESVTLINKLHQSLFHWHYAPSLGEVMEKSMELLKEGRLVNV